MKVLNEKKSPHKVFKRSIFYTSCQGVIGRFIWSLKSIRLINYFWITFSFETTKYTHRMIENFVQQYYFMHFKLPKNPFN